MPADPSHLEHVRATIRLCQLADDGTCPCGEKARRVVWRGSEVVRCYPVREEADGVSLRLDIVDGEIVTPDR